MVFASTVTSIGGSAFADAKYSTGVVAGEDKTQTTITLGNIIGTSLGADAFAGFTGTLEISNTAATGGLNVIVLKAAAPDATLQYTGGGASGTGTAYTGTITFTPCTLR